MSDRIPILISPALDANGNPISGSKLKFFQTGTSTPKNVYTDSAKTASATTITADSAGRFGEIFGDTDVPYKMQWCDASDVVLHTFDPVVPIRASQVVETPVVTKSSNFTVLTTQRGSLFEVDASSGSVNVTLPAAATAGNNFEITVKKVDSSANAVTVDGNGSETIDGATTQTLSDRYDSIIIVCDGTEWWVKAEKEATVATTPLPRSYLAGLGLSNNSTDANHDIDIATGECRDNANATNITLSSALTKQIDASWVAGTNQGGLSSSLTLSVDTWYHVHAIIVGGSADVGFDTSVTAANLVTDHSATAFRRIGSVLTDGSSNIIAFTQNGDEFLWSVPVNDYSATSTGTAAVLRALTVPTGIQVHAIHDFQVVDATSGAVHQHLITSPDQADTAPSSTIYDLQVTAIGAGLASAPSINKSIRTDTSAQVRTRASLSAADITVRGVTFGWYDGRGRDD